LSSEVLPADFISPTFRAVAIAAYVFRGAPALAEI
jgi:hypothetical protein